MAQTIEQLQADRDAVAAAKLQFLTGGQVKQVTRAGRTLVFNTTSIGDFDRALAQLDADIAALDAACTGRRRRRALSLGFQ